MGTDRPLGPSYKLGSPVRHKGVGPVTSFPLKAVRIGLPCLGDFLGIRRKLRRGGGYMKTLRVIRFKEGYKAKRYASFDTAVSDLSTMKHVSVSKTAAKSGILGAIENGSVFPAGSGYTWDYVLEPRDIQTGYLE